MRNENKNAWSKNVASSPWLDLFFIIAAMALIATLTFEVEGIENKIEKSEQIKVNKNFYTCEKVK